MPAKPKKAVVKCPKHKQRTHGRCVKRNSTEKSKKPKKRGKGGRR